MKLRSQVATLDSIHLLEDPVKLTRLLLVFGLIGWFSSLHAAILHVDGGTHQIESKPNQVIDLYVTGGVEIIGFYLAVQIGDGQAGPTITDVDLESGIFRDNHLPQITSGEGTDRLVFYDITTIASDPPVMADGLLVRLTLDASNVPHGTYALDLAGISVPSYGAAFDSTFISPNAETIPTTFLPGTINVVPEPLSATLFGGLAIMIARRPRRTR